MLPTNVNYAHLLPPWPVVYSVTLLQFVNTVLQGTMPMQVPAVFAPHLYQVALNAPTYQPALTVIPVTSSVVSP